MLSPLDIGAEEVGSLGALAERRAAHVVTVDAGVLLAFLIGAAGEGQQGGQGKNGQELKMHPSIEGQMPEKIKDWREKSYPVLFRDQATGRNTLLSGTNSAR